MKSLSNARWESRIEALLALRYHIEEIYDAVHEDSQYMKIVAFGRNTALGIAKKLQSLKFLCCLVIWYEILFKINMVSKALKKVTSDLQSSMDLFKSAQRFLENIRAEEGSNNVITDAKGLAEKVGVAAEFEKETQVCPRKIKKDFSYEIEDEPFQAGRTSFKNYSKSFKFLYDIENLQTRDRKELKDGCTHLHSVLTCRIRLSSEQQSPSMTTQSNADVVNQTAVSRGEVGVCRVGGFQGECLLNGGRSKLPYPTTITVRVGNPEKSKSREGHTDNLTRQGRRGDMEGELRRDRVGRGAHTKPETSCNLAVRLWQPCSRAGAVTKITSRRYAKIASCSVRKLRVLCCGVERDILAWSETIRDRAWGDRSNTVSRQSGYRLCATIQTVIHGERHVFIHDVSDSCCSLCPRMVRRWK
ncbi:hypothetical protein PR048_023002 [Dryococelus australis]|uniref:Uncharacterized protein n=1 Tax=Dryococelus australis TaxID=614101 RepID=A0ABQ9GSU8_9NEOP|nr:hypothetical protein PR048_023002 [Dryococelus australis]